MNVVVTKPVYQQAHQSLSIAIPHKVAKTSDAQNVAAKKSGALAQDFKGWGEKFSGGIAEIAGEDFLSQIASKMLRKQLKLLNQRG
jgi:hypothetical protein